jgi:hypothetical protein
MGWPRKARTSNPRIESGPQGAPEDTRSDLSTQEHESGEAERRPGEPWCPWSGCRLAAGPPLPTRAIYALVPRSAIQRPVPGPHKDGQLRARAAALLRSPVGSSALAAWPARARVWQGGQDGGTGPGGRRACAPAGSDQAL